MKYKSKSLLILCMSFVLTSCSLLPQKPNSTSQSINYPSSSEQITNSTSEIKDSSTSQSSEQESEESSSSSQEESEESSTSSQQESEESSFSSEESSSSSEESSSSSSSEEKPVQYVTNRFDTNSLDSGIVPKSYTPSGVKLKKNDIELFANYITDDYRNGINNGENSIVLKENGQGYILNTTPINNLKSIKFNSPTSDKVLVYGSNQFNKNWSKIAIINGVVNINSVFKYFKIQTSSTLFAFNSLDITYETANDIGNEIYNIKNNINELNNESEAQDLIKVSSTRFTNSEEWQNLGYAGDIDLAKNDALSGHQSGYNQKTDYQLKENLDVVLNEKLSAYRVADMEYGDNGNSFRINMLDSSKQGPVIYKDCAYTYVEDIAAYITAFGDVPVNMRYRKDDKQAITDWGMDGRTNYAYYHNNNTSGNFKYETSVSSHRYFFNPNQNSSNYWYRYYESDYGASIGNNEPYQLTSGYSTDMYNDGQKITRGALRFVWTYSFGNAKYGKKQTEKIANSYDRNVFFTNTHYNDFQQYLNYYGGWSLRFGNTTLGNGWGQYDSTNHMKESPNLKLTSLNEIRK